MPRILNMPKFGMWYSSEYGRVLYVQALHGVLNMSEYAYTEFEMYLKL